jgi:DNA-binding GntR family transcriptional regulator
MIPVVRRNPIRRGRLVAPQIYFDLRERIVSVSLVPGELLSEVRIAQDYGVSRTPVREAFKRLEEEGLLEVVPKVGSFVARIDLDAVRDSQFIRETLECRIVELAAARIRPAQRAQLVAVLARQNAAIEVNDSAAFFRADESMHELLAKIAGHARTWVVIHEAKAQLDRLRRLALIDPERQRKRLVEHSAIVERVCAGDGAGATAAMREHLRAILRAIDGVAKINEHYFDGLQPAK